MGSPMENKLSAVQFNFALHWLPFLKKHVNQATVIKELDGILSLWEERAQEEFNETKNVDLAIANAELELDSHTGIIKHTDLHWLRSNFESYELAPLVIAMAQILYPDDKWVELKNHDSDTVVTNESRTVVFDIMNFDRLSAGASLFLAGDKKLASNPSIKKEVAAFQKIMKDILSAQFALSIFEYDHMENSLK